MFRFAALPPLALYVHFPWCVRKCPYCDFNSHAVHGDLPERVYVDALIADLERDLPRIWGRAVGSVFLGGGTPSLFSPAAIDRFLAALRARIPLDPQAEITLEANPGTVEAARFCGYRDAGVNRLSIGIQSFDDAKLRALGRIHGCDETLRAVDSARAAGFDNLNIDLMFGLPQQTLTEALVDLRTAVALEPAHLSVYELTVEPNTLFHSHPPALPGHDLLSDMHEALHEELAAGGFQHYEVSAHARPGRACRHNLNYWRFGDYLGIGAGAHGKITDATGITRVWKVKQPRAYLAQAIGDTVVGGERRLSPAEAAFEFMLNALRLTQGVAATLFEERTGLPWSIVEPGVARARQRRLLTASEKTIQATAHGRRFLNDLVAMFLPTE